MTRVRGRFWTPSEGAATAAAEPASREAAASTAAPAGSAGTRARGRDEHLMHVRRHAVHGVGKEDRIEPGPVARARVPGRRILNDSGKRSRPLVLDSQRHGERKVLL